MARREVLLFATVLLFSACFLLEAEAAPRGGGFRGGGFRGGGSRRGGGGSFIFFGGGGGGGGGGGVSTITIIIIIIGVIVSLVICTRCIYACLDDDDDGRSYEGTYPCYLCHKRIRESEWNSGEHRRECREEKQEFFSDLETVHDEKCPKCGESLRVWPAMGAEFHCEDFACPNRGSGIVNVGSNRLNCFVCDYDICRPCYERNKRLKIEGNSVLGLPFPLGLGGGGGGAGDFRPTSPPMDQASAGGFQQIPLQAHQPQPPYYGGAELPPPPRYQEVPPPPPTAPEKAPIS